MKAFIITIGDELLIGQVTDTNSVWLAKELGLLDIPVAGRLAVGDDRASILEALHYASGRGDLIIITGGLGPTGDDITAEVLAEFFGVKTVFREEAFEKMKAILDKYRVRVTEIHRRQSMLPENAELLDNNTGTAPGMWFEYKGKYYLAMPGVPDEMKDIFVHQVLPKLSRLAGGKHIAHRTLLVAGIPESDLATHLADFEAGLPPNVKMAYLPSWEGVRLRVTVIHEHKEEAKKVLEELILDLKKRLGIWVAGEGDRLNLAQAVGNLLLRQNATLATAESCTGGNVAHLITSNPGSSRYFKGGVVAYSNEVKVNLLGVQPKTLDTHGAVSEDTAKQMAQGARRHLNATYGIATTGIAGPDGGTPDKPVGTIWIAVASAEKTVAKKLSLGNQRLINIRLSSVFVLNLLRKVFLVEKEG